MWPQDTTKSCLTDGPGSGFDYYCLNAWEPTCCWLNGIFRHAKENTKEAREPLTRPYFQHMSEAMAATCSGTVYILSDTVTDLMYQPAGQPTSIWLSHELPMLRQRYKRKLIKDLWSIPTFTYIAEADVDRKYWIDETKVLQGLNARDIEVDEFLARRFKEEKERLRNPQLVQEADASQLDARWSTCSADNAAREGYGQDYFG
jgi:hypothetical protein